MSAGSYAYKLYDEYLKRSAFAYEDAHLEEKYPDFKLLVQEYHDGILLFDLMDKEVWKKAEQDTVGLENYYNAHKDEYMWGERLKTVYATVNHPEDVARVEELVKTDLSMDSIRDILKVEEIRGVSVRIRYWQHGDNVDIDETEWKAGEFRVIPSTVDKTTKIVRVLEVRDPEPKTLNEAKGLVISAYQQQLEEDWLNGLKAKYPVTINEKILEKVKNCY